MKKFELLVSISIVAICYLIVWYAFILPNYDYEALGAIPTTVQFEKDTIQLGAIKYGAQHKAVFHFANIGSTPLLIHDVHNSCGCISTKWDRDPIKPGKAGEIIVEYNPNSLGKFDKTVEVYCNVKKRVINLKLSGYVTK